MNPDNPYAAPAVTAAPPVTYNPVGMFPAGHGRRFLNATIDTIVVYVLLVIGYVLVRIVAGHLMDVFFFQLLFAAILIGYYTILEGSFGKTLGKLITGTKVVTATGEKPSFGKAFLRSLCRHIPFDAFSFLGSTARGWHDSITKTYVVTTR